MQKRLTATEFSKLALTYDPGVYLDAQSADAVERHLQVDQNIALLESAGATEGGGRFLDIGCGMGGYLLAARRLGYEVLGIEPSLNHGRVARDVLGLPVIHDFFRPGVVTGMQFDLIMLSHVIEHIYDPKPFLDDILSVLAPGGTLLIVTPNADSLVAAALGARWPMLIPEDHVTLLSPRSLKWLLPAETSCSVRTLEYRGEFAAAWISQWRQRLIRPDTGDVTGPQPLRRQGLKTTVLKAALAVVSLPFYAAGRALDRSACIVAKVTKSAVGRQSADEAVQPLPRGAVGG